MHKEMNKDILIYTGTMYTQRHVLTDTDAPNTQAQTRRDVSYMYFFLSLGKNTFLVILVRDPYSTGYF